MSLTPTFYPLPFDPPLKPDSHCEYFESLEQKLLEQSEKLTNFMGKSLINDKSKSKIKLALSPARDTHLRNAKEDENNVNRGSLKSQASHYQKPYIKRVKELCLKLRQPKGPLEEQFRSPNKLVLREKYENERKLAYNISYLKKQQRRDQPAHEAKLTDKHCFEPEEHLARQEKLERTEKLEKIEKGGEQEKVQKSDKLKRLYRIICENKSLKDTISTQSCKSLKSFGDQGNTSISHQIKLEDFEVLKYLAEGKFGIVYLVKHKATNFLCALKRIPSLAITNDPKVLTQRIREIKIQSYLDHPNIVQLYSVFVEDGYLYLLMELCYSGNLYSNLKLEGRFSEDKIRTVIKQICYAVEYMHDNDILHRDLKPENILFHESIAKICDFGWSVNSPLLRDTFCGTPLYSSPEVVQKQQYDNKVDIWNVGVLTYELLYGKVPFEIRSEEDLSKVVDDDIYFPRSKPASPEIKDFILHCLSKNPKQRFSITKLMDHQFLNPVQSRG